MGKVIDKSGETTACRQVYAELLCDFMFKRLFGTIANKDILIWFLNILMDDKEIVDVSFIPTEHLGMTEEDRKAIFDISVECKNGETFIIEMQKGYQKHFRKRAVYYTSYPILEQGRTSRDEWNKEHQGQEDAYKFKWNFDLKPITVVAILNFKFDHDGNWPADRYHSSYRLREDINGEVMTDVLRYVFLELGRFNKKLWELESLFDKWMYLFKHIHEMVVVPEIFSGSEFERLFILSKISNFTPEELKQYEQSIKNMSDYYNIIDTAAEEAEKRGRAEGRAEGLVEGRAEGIEIGMSKGRAEGRAEGLAEGIEEGIEEGVRKTAKNLKQLGVPVDIIAQSTGLLPEIIESL